MKAIERSVLCAMMLALPACGEDSQDHGAGGGAGGGGGGGNEVSVEGALDGGTWQTGKTYRLTGHTFVTSGTLTIQPGVVVKGEAGSSLVVTRDAKIDAVGTAEQPIVFTSAEPEGSRDQGDWGGLVLLGKAPINVEGGEEKIEGFEATETRTTYGGDDAAHDCGRLSYVRVEFAGFELAPDNELNGLSLGACGTDTEIDHVQVHRGSDDGIEVFGGTVFLKHVLITQPDDDGLDWDFGWVGGAQFLIVQQGADRGNNAIEADNQKDDNDAEPRSAPRLWNVSLIGSNGAAGVLDDPQQGLLLRRGTAGTLHNAVIAYFSDRAYNVADESTAGQATGGELAIASSVLFHNGGADEPTSMEAEDDDGGYDDASLCMSEATNRFVDPLLDAARSATGPSFVPADGSPLLEGGATPPAGFDAAATYVGAVGTTDWTAGWAAFPEN